MMVQPKTIPVHEMQEPTLDGNSQARRAVFKPFVRVQFNSPTFFQIVADVSAIAISFIIFYFLKLSSSQAHQVVGTAEFFITVLTSSVVFWITVYWFQGLYKNWYIRSPFDEFFSIIKSSAVAGLIVLMVMYLESGYMRVKFIPYLLILIGLVCSGRLIARRIQRRLRMSGRITVPAILVGRQEKLRSLMRQVQLEPAWGYSVVGVVLDTMSTQNMDGEFPQILGRVDRFDSILDEYKPSAVLLALDSADHDLMLDIVAKASDRGVSVKIEPDLYEIITGQVKTLQIYGSPLIEVNPELLRPWQRLIKRVVDITISSVVLLLGLPLWLLIAAIIKWESRGPALFSQLRVGRNGVAFRMYKFRSMVQDAEAHGPQWTKVGDPRVTRFGYFLRRTHLDEIPQLWNILIGDMSLVGPRPEQPRYVELFSASIPYYNRRHRVRPGLTGWWQVKYTTYQETLDEIKDRIRYDFFYIENMSLRLDFEIIVRTIFLMFRGHGQA